MAQSFIRITDVRDTPGTTAERAGKMDVLIQYVVDERRAYVTVMPKEEYTPEAALARIKGEEQERMKIIGQTIVISSGG